MPRTRKTPAQRAPRYEVVSTEFGHDFHTWLRTRREALAALRLLGGIAFDHKTRTLLDARN